MSSENLPFINELTEDQVIIRDTIRDFAEQKIRPVIMEYDESQKFPIELLKELGKLGFLGIIFPEEYGGAGLGYIEFEIIIEELARIDPSIALSVAAHNGLCTNHIYKFGNEEQKKKYVPDLASGRKIGAWALTEPSSGSDASGLLTTAEKNGDSYTLNGSKNFITHGANGETAVVMALTDKDKGKKGISAFVIEKDTPGFIVGKKENKLGMRSCETSQLAFENCKVPAANLIGEEGMGFIQSLQILDGGRISIASLSVGLAQGCLDESVKYANEREQFGKPLSKFQATQFKFADMQTNIEAARMLTLRAAYMNDQGMPNKKEAAIAKLFASEIAEKAASEAVQIHGGYGFIKDYPVEKYYRDVKLLTIGEGTSEIQRIVIARDLLSN
ncbi:MAG: acyl-CoA dehydrogenase family protein [Ignavibacterium sp.]|nr:MAG: acyl-CoA dehydrogenase family protein [Ignavibacterium sp.]